MPKNRAEINFLGYWQYFLIYWVTKGDIHNSLWVSLFIEYINKMQK